MARVLILGALALACGCSSAKKPNDETPLRQIELPGARALAVAPNGELVVAASQDETKAWQPRRDDEASLGGGCRDLVFSADGSTLAGVTTDGSVRTWRRSGTSLVDGGRVELPDAVCCAASGTGQRIAVGNRDGTITLWSPASGSVRQLGTSGATVTAIAFAADDASMIAADLDGRVRTWTLSGAERQLAELGAPVLDLAGTADGILAAFDRTLVRVAADGTRTGLGASRHGHWITSVAAAGDGSRAVSGDRDGRVCVWSTSTDGAQVAATHKGVVRAVALSADGSLAASCGDDGKVKLTALR